MKHTINVDAADKLQQVESKELARVVLQLRSLTELDLWVLIDSIQKVQAVEELVLDNYLRTEEPEWENPVYIALLEAIGNIPKIGILELRCCGRNPVFRFPVRLLTLLLTTRRNLPHGSIQELVIFRSLFRGTNEEYQQLGQALRAQTALQEVYAECTLQLPTSIDEIKRPRTNIQQYSGYIFSALSSLPNLERVCLHISDYQVPAPDSLIDMAHYTNSSKLNEMYLYGVYLNTQQTISIAQNLKHHSSLRRLALELYDLDQSNAPAIAELVESNTTLEGLDLHVRNTMTEDDCLLCIASALKQNTKLTTLELYNSKLISESTEQGFADMLHTNNTSLLGLRLLSEQRLPRQHAINYARGQMELYLKLNRRGFRKRILQDFEHLSRHEWVTFLANDCHDIDILYYYLRLNPLLCSGCFDGDDTPQQPSLSVVTPPPLVAISPPSSSSKRQYASLEGGSSLECPKNKRRKCSED